MLAVLANAVGALDAGEYGADDGIPPDGNPEDFPQSGGAPADGGDFQTAEGQGSQVPGDVPGFHAALAELREERRSCQPGRLAACSRERRSPTTRRPEQRADQLSAKNPSATTNDKGYLS